MWYVNTAMVIDVFYLFIIGNNNGNPSDDIQTMSQFPESVLNADQQMGSRENLWNYYPPADIPAPTLPPNAELCVFDNFGPDLVGPRMPRLVIVYLHL